MGLRYGKPKSSWFISHQECYNHTPLSDRQPSEEMVRRKWTLGDSLSAWASESGYATQTPN